MNDLKVKKLNHRREAITRQIHQLSQSAYQIEAELLGVTDFPPLNRTVYDISNSSSQFFGCIKNNQLVAAIEIETTSNHHINIACLVVSPDCFRRGLGKQLVLWTLEHIHRKVTTVSIASTNVPAIRLYEKLGFQKSSQRSLDENITIVTFTLSASIQPDGSPF
jgi:ribosomal protein S18 acetylase RimI-like enzyme